MTVDPVTVSTLLLPTPMLVSIKSTVIKQRVSSRVNKDETGELERTKTTLVYVIHAYLLLARRRNRQTSVNMYDKKDRVITLICMTHRQ